MSDIILITGATGNVGRELVSLLHKSGQPIRAAVVSEAEAASLPPDVPWCVFDFTNPRTFPAAFAGVDRLFLMRPPHLSNIQRDIKPAIEFAAQSNVRQIVFLSLLGAERNPVVPHAKVETLLQKGAVPYTLLRCGFFMQNLSTTHRDDIRAANDIFIPAGMGKTAFIDVRDIAAVATKVLTEPGHEYKAYALTGSEALNYQEVAQLMTAVLKRPITYSRPSLVRFAWRKWRAGWPAAYVGVVSGIYLTTQLGLAQEITEDVPALLGRPPLTMRQFVRDHAAVWETEPASSINAHNMKEVLS
ncbi:MAG: SDR family oxidoreductase [Ardenticatenaceae bacterium]|nr:SDR family oxidoreductase [Ardenticatenaceae bacterium]